MCKFCLFRGFELFTKMSHTVTSFLIYIERKFNYLCVMFHLWNMLFNNWPLWWLILCQLDQTRGCPLFYVCLWGCFPKILAFELVNWIKQTALPNAHGFHQITGGAEENKRVKEGWVPVVSASVFELNKYLLALALLVYGSQFSDLSKNLHHQLSGSHHLPSWVSSLQKADHVTSQSS